MKSDLLKAVAITAELCGTDLSAQAAKAFADNLAEFPEQEVLAALKRCQMELKGRLTMAEVVNRIDDGRPGADEAWGMITWDEYETVVVTTEMQAAQRVAWSLYPADKTGARMAFKETYAADCRENRSKKLPVSWVIEQGWDASRREGPIREAANKGLISKEVAMRCLPPPTVGEIEGAVKQRLLEKMKPKEIGE